MNDFNVDDMLGDELIEKEEQAPANESGDAQPQQGDQPDTGEGASSSNDTTDLDTQVRALKEQVMRQAAEFQNYKRRMDKSGLEAVTLAKASVIQSLLDVFDDLRRSIEAAEAENVEESSGALRDGVKLVYQKFQDELARFGVEPIVAEGVPFNEDEHDAMMQQPAPEGVAPGMVLHEIQKGYRMGDRILRHSKVVVAT